MRVYKGVESGRDYRIKRAYTVSVGFLILMVGMVVGAFLALYVIEQYLLAQPVNRQVDEVPQSAFCQGGLEPQPKFCN